MIGMKPNDSIKLDFVELDKSESYSKEEALPEDGFYRYLHNPGEQRGDKNFMVETLDRIVEEQGNRISH